MRSGTRTLVACVLAATGLLSSSACAVANSGSVTAEEGTVRIVLPQEPPTLEPCESSLSSTGVVVRSNITEPLVERNGSTGELEPLLATAWQQTAPTRWTFTLREGVRFSDGTPFTAASAAYSVDRAVNSQLGCNVEGYVFGDDDLGVTAVDPRTLVVTTPKPDPILPLRLSFIEMVPESTSSTEKVREPIGTGPYKIGSWDTGIRLTLVANDDYWGKRPAFTRAVYVWRGEGVVRAAMVVNGEADIATGLGPEDGAGDRGVAFQNNETTAVRIQTSAPPLNDIRVRQAIKYAIDRRGITAALFGEDAKVAAQLVAPGIVGYNPTLQPWPTDPDRARALLAEARADGVDLSPTIRLIGRTAQFPKIDEAIQVIQDELSSIGLNVQIEMMDTAGTVKMQVRPFPENAGPYLLMIQHGNQAGDAAFSMDNYLRSDGKQSSGGSAALDKEIDAAEAQVGAPRQDALARTFADEPDQVAQFAYLAHMSGELARSKRVTYEPDSATGDEMRLADMKPVTGTPGP